VVVSNCPLRTMLMGEILAFCEEFWIMLSVYRPAPLRSRALLALRRQPDAADCSLPPADFGCGLPRCGAAMAPAVRKHQTGAV